MTACPACKRELPSSPRSLGNGGVGNEVAHVREDGSECWLGAVVIMPVSYNNHTTIMTDDSRWDLTEPEPMFRYIHADRDRKHPWLRAARERVIAELERAESTFWDRQLQIIKAEYTANTALLFKGFPVYKRPPIVDRDPGDESPSDTVTITFEPRRSLGW